MEQFACNIFVPCQDLSPKSINRIALEQPGKYLFCEEFHPLISAQEFKDEVYRAYCEKFVLNCFTIQEVIIHICATWHVASATKKEIGLEAIKDIFSTEDNEFAEFIYKKPPDFYCINKRSKIIQVDPMEFYKNPNSFINSLAGLFAEHYRMEEIMSNILSADELDLPYKACKDE